MYQIFRSWYASLIITAIIAIQLVACGGSGSAGGSNDSSATAVDSLASISGSVGDGPIIGATINVFNNRGKQIGTIVSDTQASYNLSFNAKGNEYPLLLSVNDGFDLVTGAVPDFQMLSVMLSPADKQVNINPFSTLIVKIAGYMKGGVNPDNIETAKGYVTGKLGFGLDPRVVEDPIATRITDSNAANIIKASEALGEMVRRTRDTLSAAGTPVTGDDVVDALAADITDGVLDGSGKKPANATLSSVAQVVSAQVLVEALSNNLRVGGVIATGVIDQAIATTHPNATSQQMTGRVRITKGMLKQANDSLEVATELDSSEAVTGLLATVNGLTVDSLSADIEKVLPAESSATLDTVIELSATSSTDDPAAIDQGTDTSSNTTSDTGGTTSTSTSTSNTTTTSAGSPTVSDRVATVPVVYYPFTEGAGGVVADRSGNGAPMDLALSGAVSWSGSGNGVVFSGGRVGTTGAATKVIDALRASNMSTFEVWVEPANVTQTGPSRMISVGGGTNLQNFMLGQKLDEVRAKLMHTGKDENGKPRLSTRNAPLGTTLVHLVHTYDGAVERLYINGVPYSRTLAIGGSYSNWDVTDLFSIGNEASLGRPYAGVIRLVAVYDRALGDAEVQQNFAAGAGANSSGTGDGGTVVSGDSGTTGPANSAPVISGTPAGSVLANEAYIFRPTASDADGNVLAFSIANKPGWASFSDTTGRLKGTPGDADAGLYDGIRISVTDGLDTASLPVFSIRVDAVPGQTGSFSLGWTAPVTRADGTALSLADIDGYRIYYGHSSGDYPNSVNVADGSAQAVTVTDVPPGDYHVVMTTYDDAGRESAISAEITKSAQ